MQFRFLIIVKFHFVFYCFVGIERINWAIHSVVDQNELPAGHWIVHFSVQSTKRSGPQAKITHGLARRCALNFDANFLRRSSKVSMIKFACTFCTVCEYYVHVDCQDFAVSVCKECATYVPSSKDTITTVTLRPSRWFFVCLVVLIRMHYFYLFICLNFHEECSVINKTSK